MLASVLCISHGGGPLPILGHPSHVQLVKSLKTKAPEVLRLGTKNAPRAIVIVTAHWQTTQPSISGAERHSLYYDYGGFPEEAYKLKYDAAGSPSVAKELYDIMKEVGLNPALDVERGWDHGVFIPMLLINPAADIPLVQVSVPHPGLPEREATMTMFKMGLALNRLRASNVAIVGSGFATLHNISLIAAGFAQGQDRVRQKLAEVPLWSAKLTAAVQTKDLSKREAELMGWREFPGSEVAQPKHHADHLFPLLVCAAAAGDDVEAKTWEDEMMGSDMVSYYWA